MSIQNIKQQLLENGYQGFYEINKLFQNDTVIPKEKGIYLILYPYSDTPKFRPIGSGGHFKGRNPNVTIEELQNNWVEDSPIVYIGKAGSLNGSATLHSRLKQYLNFGQGKPVGHWGGRFIWQLQCVEDLIVCWYPTPKHEPSEIESYLITKFKENHKKRPFANLKD